MSHECVTGQRGLACVNGLTLFSEFMDAKYAAINVDGDTQCKI